MSKANPLYPRKEKYQKKLASPNFKPAEQSIEQRPESIHMRENIGNFEIDAVSQTRSKNECLLSLTDRKSRRQIIRFIPDKSATSANQALRMFLQEYQIDSITADNGAEFSCLSDVFTLSIFIIFTLIHLGREGPMKSTID